MRKSTAVRLRDVKHRNKLLLTAHQRGLPTDSITSPPKPLASTESSSNGSPKSSIDGQRSRVPLSAHEVVFELERKRFESATSRSQGFPDNSRALEPERYCSDPHFADNLAGIRHSSLLTSFNSLVQNLFCGASHVGTAISTSISNRVKAATLLETGSCIKYPRESPKDVRTLYDVFDLNPRVSTYACCPLPTCSAIYPLKSDLGYPLRCVQTKFDIACKEPLTDGFQSVNGKSAPKPIKPFHYHHFHDHVASMLARPGIEEAIQLHMASGSLQEELTDIMSSGAVRSLLDHTGLPFVRTDGTELRLIWSLAADWYNPRLNKASGKVVSSGAIAMVCLSLPPDLRNLEENVYLAGVIPGPQEPSVDATNHFVTPLINDLVVSYNRGVRYSRTYLYPAGRTCRSAVVPVIADTMASKKITGNCGHGAKYFCSRCRLSRDAIDNFDPATWPRGLTRIEHEEFADLWRLASSKSVQNRCLTKHGIRWSPLLLLSYWKPSAWTITEAVHVILLGLIPRHCRDLLGLNFKDLPWDDPESDPPTAREMEQAKSFLRDRPNKLSSVKMKALQELCSEQRVVLPPLARGRRTKKDYISALLGYHNTVTPCNDPEEFGLEALFGVLSLETPDLSDHSDAVPANPPPRISQIPPSNPITKQMLSTIRNDIKATLRPDWQAHLPENFGSPEHGKLKADQWRTALEFDLPVSLVRIKYTQKPSGNITTDERLQKLVDLTMDLALAVAWGLSRRTSAHHAERYMFYMKRYLTGIKELFPEYNLKPNHHYALHIPDILLGFGPLHGTWAFSTERLIGRLQKMNTNFRIGEMEETAMSMFCRRAKFIHLMESPRCPAVLKEVWNETASSLNLRDLDSGALSCKSQMPFGHQVKPSILDSDIQAALSSILGQSLSGAQLHSGTVFVLPNYKSERGVTYSAFDKSLPHSLVYFHKLSSRLAFQSSSPCRQLFPGQIRLIFQHCCLRGNQLTSEVFVALHEFRLAHVDRDPFSAYPEFRAAIYIKEPLPPVTIIKADQLHCHANYRPWDESSVVMRAIDRCY